MRKLLAALAAVTMALAVFGCQGEETALRPSEEALLYFVDAEMMRLIPSKLEVSAADGSEAARIVLRALVEGHDDNPQIRRIMPKMPEEVSVYVSGEIAYVDLGADFVAAHLPGRNAELLTVYQIVNSLSSLEEVVNVRFTIDGKTQRDFLGFIDMRETFVPDYYV